MLFDTWHITECPCLCLRPGTVHVTVQEYPQIAELATIVRAFEKFKLPLSLVTDSAYVARIAERAEHSLLKEVSNPNLYSLLSKLVSSTTESNHITLCMQGHTPASQDQLQRASRGQMLWPWQSGKVEPLVFPPECASPCSYV